VISDVLRPDERRGYRSLVRDKKIAAQASAFNGLPGTKYPTLIVMRAVPTPGHTNAEVQAAIREQLERLKTEPITDDELKMVKTRAKAALIRSLDDNSGIANQLAFSRPATGTGARSSKTVERLDKVTKEDVMRVANATFVPTNRTVAMIENADAARPRSERETRHDRTLRETDDRRLAAVFAPPAAAAGPYHIRERPLPISGSDA
jgi:predicted Zn-dependent peptidase